MNILKGDCLETLRTLESDSVDSVVTDPPYGLKFMGKKWDYEVPSVEIWREVLRVLKPGGHVLSFCGTRTYHRMVVNMEDAGFEIRDQIQWIYGQGFPKSLNVGNGIGTALKPANEPICLARKPLEGTVAANVLKYGTGGINVDASRIEPSSDYGRSAANAKGTVNAHDGFEGKSFKISERDGDYASPLGRFPANVLFDEEAANLLDQQSGNLKNGGGNSRSPDVEGLFGTRKSGNTKFAGDSGGASRFFYVAKASKRERNAGLEGMPGKQVSHMITGSGKPSESVKERAAEGEPNRFTATHQNHHPTVKPIKLMQYLIRMITPPGGVVLDPFMGSGSTGCAARSLGFEFIGCEIENDYIKIAKKRIKHHEKEAV